MKVSYIYFDNDLDITPGLNEEFTYKPGDNFIMHWNTSTPPPENYPYPHLLLRMYNVSYIREIDFAHHLPVLHPNSPTNKQTIPDPIPNPTNPMAACFTEPWYPTSIDDNVQEDTKPNPEPLYDTPLPPKLNEICICEDVPDPTCPIHRKST